MRSIKFILGKKSAQQFKIVSFILLCIICSASKATNLHRFHISGNRSIDISLETDSIVYPYHPDISYQLEGKHAGVYVKETSSTFGTSPKILIRGNSTFTGNNRPLWLIDGVKQASITDIDDSQLNQGNLVDIFTSSVAGINPDDIESIEILKDISGTAIYGSDGANGVILVTTKKGKAGKLSINYTGKFTFNRKPKASDYNLLNSEAEMEIYEEMKSKGWLDYTSMQTASDYGVFGKMYQMLNQTDDSGNFLLQNTPEAKAAFLHKAGLQNTDWFDELFKNNITQQHSFDISGGNDKTTFYTSFSHFNDGGYAIGFNAKRTTLNANVQQKIGKRLKLGLKLTGSQRNQETCGVENANFDQIEGKYTRSFESNPFTYAMNTSRAMRTKNENGELKYFRRNYAPFNIIEEIENNYLTISGNDLSAQFHLDYQISDNLYFYSHYQSRKTKTDTKINVTDNSNVIASTFNLDEVSDPVDRDNKDYGLNSSDFKYYLKWDQTISSNHQIQVKLGFENSKLKRKIGSYEEFGSIQAHHYSLSNQKYNTKFKKCSLFSDVNYTYKNRYVLSGTYAKENTNYQGSEKQKMTTWQLASKWKIINENHQEKLTCLSLKLAYGKSEKSPLSIYSTQKIGQAVLSPELNKELNLKLKFGLFSNRLTGNISYFNRKSKDLVEAYESYGIWGRSIEYQNIGELKTSGFEIDLNSTILKYDSFSWNTNWNINFYRSEVTSQNSSSTLGEATTKGALRTGKPLRALYSTKFAGLNSEGIPTFYGENDEIVNYLYLQSRNNIKSILKYEGPTEPKIFGGFSNNFRYRNLSLNIGLTYAFGHKIRTNSNYQPFYSDANSFPKDIANRWRESGDESNTTIPKIIDLREAYLNGADIENAYISYNLSSESIAKGDFIRLNHIGLTYQLPERIISGLFLKRASLSVQANNVCLLYSDSKLHGIDPEYTPVGGISLPVPKSYTITVKIGL